MKNLKLILLLSLCFYFTQSTSEAQNYDNMKTKVLYFDALGVVKDVTITRGSTATIQDSHIVCGFSDLDNNIIDVPTKLRSQLTNYERLICENKMPIGCLLEGNYKEHRTFSFGDRYQPYLQWEGVYLTSANEYPKIRTAQVTFTRNDDSLFAVFLAPYLDGVNYALNLRSLADLKKVDYVRLYYFLNATDEANNVESNAFFFKVAPYDLMENELDSGVLNFIPE
ncbi:hypothetical protein N7U66_01965 [Lacinutrix neustonica]|uniref:Uncharacterized protein n=1 Tax=Lacinutrix neustonica TaxID=2980107 RepID=A0A9E8MXS6_9FLAO|nr:hypothetical protein [Lacinutrix neustonica]WAC02502.1 hypothetical protein N7U66_01965 [Lacinutrix neustonica]